MRQIRADAAADILAQHGLEGVQAFAADTQSPHLVGEALAETSAPALDADMLSWLEQDTPRPDIAYGYLTRRIFLAGQHVVEELLDGADSPQAKAAVMRAAGDPPSAWARLDGLGDDVARAYWQRFSPYGLGGDFREVTVAAEGLIGVGRHAAALSLIGLYARRIDSPELAELAAAAFEALLAASDPDPEARALSAHRVQTILAFLHRHHDAIGRGRLLTIEWQLLPALRFDADAPALHDALAEDPEFFAEVVTLAHLADQDTLDPDTVPAGAPDDRHTPANGASGGQDVDPEDREDDQEQSEESENRHEHDAAQNAEALRREMVRRAYELLHYWRHVPGAGPDGVIVVQRLDAWVDQARALLTERGRLMGADHIIGRVLANAQPDADGTAPPRAVRDLLERIGNDDLDNGLALGIYNRRGISSRGIFEGGDRERNLAAAFREQAASAAAWLRTRRLLRRLADDYEREARDNDERAERRRRGLDG